MPANEQRDKNLLLCILYLADSYRDSSNLAEITGLGKPCLEECLQDLTGEGLLHHCVMTERWRSLASHEAVRERALSLFDEAQGMERLIGGLAAGRWAEEASACIRFLDEHMASGDGKVELFFELVLLFFIRTGEELKVSYDATQIRKYMQSVLFLQILCASTKKHLELAATLGRVYYELNLIIQDDGFSTEFFLGIVNAGFSKGNIFSDLLSSLEALPSQSSLPPAPNALAELNILPEGYDSVISDITRTNPKYASYLAGSLYVCLSHLAMHMQKYTLSSELYSALCRLQEDEENQVSLTWSAHYCFVLLREGRFAEALEQLEPLLEISRKHKHPVGFASAARGIALYYFIYNDIEKAHATLDRETQYAIRNGIPHAHFLDPLVLDMLYVFEQQGFGPIERYEIESTIGKIMASSNLLLQGAAQRVQALLLRGQGTNPRHVAQLLQSSQANLHPERDKREITLNLHELANTLAIVGEYERAAKIRQSVAERLGCMLDSTTPYRVASLLATNLRDIPDFKPSQPVTAEIKHEALGVTGLKKGLRALGGVHRSLQQVTTGQGKEAMLQEMADVLHFELHCTWTGVFLPLASGFTLAAASPEAGNMEVTPERQQGIDWAVRNASGALDVLFKQRPGEFYLCLEAGEERPWIVALLCPTADCLLNEASPLELEMMAKFLASEIRGLLRLHRAHEDRGSRMLVQETSGVLPVGGKELEEVVGDEALALLAAAERVAQTDAYILLHGETGVGKEVTARHIHRMSGRSGAFVSVNPASISESLFESEFFGHERGSFTGAVGQRKGYIELADQGTLFIDEVGEMPLSLQTKLLRVLQEQAFVRVGGNTPIRSDFRLITATNKDLLQEVRRGAFRQDLLHRIMVVPVEIPPLRQRRKDIGQFLDAYTRFFCQRYQRPTLNLSQKQRKIFYQYDWPGNVRELKNTVERMVIQGRFSPDQLLFNSLPADRPARDGQGISADSFYQDYPSLEELERNYLGYVLEQCGGRVRGEGGAAELLGIKTSTLYGKLKKYGLEIRK